VSEIRFFLSSSVGRLIGKRLMPEQQSPLRDVFKHARQHFKYSCNLIFLFSQR
jgi:hypothetical protein